MKKVTYSLAISKKKPEEKGLHVKTINNRKRSLRKKD